MRSRMHRSLLLTAILGMAAPLLTTSIQAAPPHIMTAENSDEELALWGIKDGCLNSAMVRHFYVLDGHSAVIELVGGKRVLMQFRGKCEGIEQHGFVHTAHNNRVCPRSNAIRVLQTGTRCEVESLEPYRRDR